MTATTVPSAPGERAKIRLDQWLWFARFAKSRSLAARLCTAGVIAVNGGAVVKASHPVREGDIVVLPHGGWQRTVRVLALGVRRGPPTEARKLYEEAGAALRTREALPGWVPLLADDDPEYARL